MSAFVVSHKTISNVVEAFCRWDSYWASVFPAVTQGANGDVDSLTAIGRNLLALNVAAVEYRYPDVTRATMPGTVDEQAEWFRFKGSPRSKGIQPTERMLQWYESISCLLYQCSEGDFPSDPRYREIERLKMWLADELIKRIPGYDQAQWDAA